MGDRMAVSETSAVVYGQALFKHRNRTSIVRLVKERPGISRAEIVDRTGLTKSTISVLVQELLDEGWLREGPSTATAELGRRRTPLALDGTRLALLGAEVGADGVQVVGCNLLGEVLESRRAPCSSKPAGAVQALARLVAQADGAVRARGYRSLGLAVGVPGVVDVDASRVRFAPSLGWQDAPLGTLLRAALPGRRLRGLPVTVLNDARASAFSQYVFGEERHAEPLAFVSLGMTVGAGFVVGGRLQTGHNGLAGQVGHIVLEPGGRPCSCGRRGCAETLVSQAAISRLITGKDAPVLGMRELTARLASGDGATAEALARAGRHLGVLLLAIGSVVNPAEIVLGGPLAQIGDPYVVTAIETVRQELGRFDHVDVTIRISRFGDAACAMGAAASVLQDAVTA